MARLGVPALAMALLLGSLPVASAQESGASLSQPRPGVGPAATPAPAPAAPAVPTPAPGYGTAPPAAPIPPPAPALTPPGALQLHLTTDIATRLQVLDGSFRALASRGAGSPLDGIMSIVSGGLSITFGVLYDDPLSSYLYLWGAAYIARGVLSLAFRPNVTDPAITFGHMTMNSPAEVDARLRYGEAALEYLARRFRTGRMIDAGINLVAGLLVIPVYLGPSDFRVDDFFDYFVLVGSGISIITGIIGLVSKSEAERRWAAYRELRDRLESNKLPHVPAPTSATDGLRFAGVGAAPLRGGAALTLRTAF